MKHIGKSVISTILTALAAGCGYLPSTPVGSQMADVPADGWRPDAPVDFNVTTYDTVDVPAPPYRLVVHVRYRRGVAMSSLPLVVQEMSLTGGYTDPDTIDIPLNTSSDPSGRRGGYNIYETCDTLRSGFTLPEGYTLSISPASEVRGIVSIGYSLLDHNSEKY